MGRAKGDSEVWSAHSLLLSLPPYEIELDLDEQFSLQRDLNADSLGRSDPTVHKLLSNLHP